MGSIDWSMWEAIGTVGATSIALLTTIGKWVKDWLFRPQFDYHIHLLGDSNPESVGWVFEIFNKGRTTALNLKVKIGQIKFPDSSSDLNLDLGEMKSLRWRDEGRYEVVRTHPTDPTKWAFGYDTLGYDFNRQDCEIELIITGDNFPGIKKVLKLINSPKLGEVQMTIIKYKNSSMWLN
jgi:hypothetical protein